MPRQLWHDLPAGITTAIEDRFGAVTTTEPATTGVNSAFSATLHTGQGRVFCKATLTDAPTAWMHRTEAAANPHLPRTTPRLLARIEHDGWLALVFEHVQGRHADLSPHSPDLPLLARTLTDNVAALTPNPWADAVPMARRWAARPGWHALAATPDTLDPWTRAHLDEFLAAEAAAPDLLHGDTLLHADLNPHNLLITHQPTTRLHVIDWALACTGPAWADTAYTVVRLIATGHTPDDAETWAQQTPSWHTAAPSAITTYAITLTGLWHRRTRLRPTPTGHHLTTAATTWLHHRLAPPSPTG
ncbi:aminoglycoside phosphotransferase family protein [Saccharothrix sp. Mg75]|uniref:aminoglycoside phosphotransferase family protein n=1 Tax=Saccharothrix sp. Mg75 TaxID=3445357 RepID=UPI003EEFFFBD